MWDDVILGRGNKGNSSTLVRELKGTKCHISENKVSYWISNAYLDTGMTIFKDTTWGVILEEKLMNGTSDIEISEWIDMLVLEHIDKGRLVNKIENAIEQSFEVGRRHQANEIKKALML